MVTTLASNLAIRISGLTNDDRLSIHHPTPNTQNMSASRKSLKKRSTYWQLMPYIYPQRWTILLAFIWTLIFTSFWPIQAWLAGEISKYLGTDVVKLAQLAAAGGLVYILQGIAQYGQDNLMAKATFAITLDLRQRTYGHLLKVSSDRLSQLQVGDLSYRLTEDIDRIGEIIHKIFHQFTPSVLQLIVVLGYMIYLNWQLTLAVFIIAPIIAVLVGYFGEKLQEQSLKSQNRIADLSSLVTENLSGIRLIQSFAAEPYALQQFSKEAEFNRQARYLTEKIKAFQFPVISFLQVVSILFVFVLAAWQISIKNLTVPQFVAYLTNIALIINPIAITTSNYNELKQSESSVDRVFDLLDLPLTIAGKHNAIALPAIAGKLEYQHVDFGYSHDRLLLKDFNLTIQPGETIALVGTSGAGKSTILNLLPRFYDVLNGAIKIDGIDIRDVTLSSLRRQIGIVPQDTTLFSGSIAQNIAFGQTEFNIESVEAAAKIANAHEFIAALPQGYYTYVGERGTSLSGGQKQRIAIARAILSNPRILILDEATSALDSESEALVQQALERAMVGRTVFIIAHRLATVRTADRILAIEDGRIIESGTHAQLLAQNGRYAQFYARQFNE
jgi:ATP-binding cassette, subfamily B, bacterial